MGNVFSSKGEDKKYTKAKPLPEELIPLPEPPPDVLGYVCDLKSPEVLRPLSSGIPGDAIPSKAAFIGSIQGGEVSAMGCLLSGDRLLTALHIVMDVETSEYKPLELIRVYFVKNDRLYAYGVQSIIHDGMEAVRNYGRGAITFDYALLQLTGSPTKDLEGFLDLDSVDHFGSASVSDPSDTLALSGPVFGQDEAGRLTVLRYASVAENEAAKGGFYMFPQMGHHVTAPGMSGQAVFPLDPHANKTLYSVHLGVDHAATSRFGFKVCEYLATRRSVLATSTVPMSAMLASTSGVNPFASDMERITRENLRRRGQDKIDINTFLTNLALAIRKGEELPLQYIPKALCYRDVRFVDSHQEQHLPIGGRKGKSVFSDVAIGSHPDNVCMNALANCINKLCSEYYRHNRVRLINAYCVKQGITKEIFDKIQADPRAWQAFTHDVIRHFNFIVDLSGFGISFGTRSGAASSYIKIEGFSGTAYHIYPFEFKKAKDIDVIIDAKRLLDSSPGFASSIAAAGGASAVATM